MGDQAANIRRVLARSEMRELDDMEKAIRLVVDCKFSVSQVCGVLDIPKRTLYTHVNARKKGKEVGERGRKRTLSEDQEKVVVDWLDAEIAKGTPVNYPRFRAKV